MENSNRERRRPKRGAIVPLVVGLATLALVWVHSLHQGVRLTPADFMPQVDEQRIDRGWAMIRPGGNGPGDMTMDEGMPLLRTSVEGETAAAHVRVETTGSLDLWIAGKVQDHRALSLSLDGPNGAIPLKMTGSRRARQSNIVWTRFLASDTRPGDYTLAVTAAPSRSAHRLAQFGEVVLVDHDHHPLFSLQSEVAWRFIRAVGIAVFLIGAGSLGRLQRRPWHLLMLAIAFAAFIEYYIPTAGWGITDDTFHYLADQSSLREGHLSGLFSRHQGHVMPVYRALIEVCYLLTGVNPWLERGIAAATTLIGAWVLRGLIARWTGSSIGATVAVCLYLTNQIVHAEQVYLTSADSLPPCMLCVILAMAALDRYLRDRRLVWLVLSGISALAAPLIYAGGIVAYPALVAQILVFGSPRLRTRREWAQIAAVYTVSILFFLAAYASGHQPGSEPPQPIVLPKTSDQLLALLNKCGLAFLFGLQSIFARPGINDGLGLFVLILILLPMLLFAPSRRARRSFLLGLLLILPVYFMIFGIRTDEYVHKSHYQILAFIGFTIVMGAAIAVWARGGRFRRRTVMSVSLLLVAYLAARVITVSSAGFRTWDYLMQRQRHVFDAIAEPLRAATSSATASSSSSSSALDLGRYEVCHVTASSKVSASHLGALLMHRRFDVPAELKVATDSALASPIARNVYRNLCLYSLDELRLPKKPGSAVILADGIRHFPTNSFFSLHPGPGAIFIDKRSADAASDALALLELPNGIERPQGRWGAWLARTTRLRIYSPASATLTIDARLSPGAANPDPQRTIRISCGSAKRTWSSNAPGGADFHTDVPVQAGLNDVLFDVVEPPTVTAQPNGDTRILMLWCAGLHLQLTPGSAPSASARLVR